MDLVKLDNLIDKIVASQNQRSGKIITNRYGLDSADTKTLAELGDVYGLTRERVRQIQAAVIKAIREEISRHKEVMAFLKFINGYLEKFGGVRSSQMLSEDLINESGLGHEPEVFKNRLNFLAEVVGEPTIQYGDDDWHDVWHNDDEAHKTACAVVNHLLSFKEHNFDKFIGDASAKFKLPEKTIVNYLHTSKNFGQGPYGDLGAKHWVHVNPKTARDKNWLVLTKAAKPLHFREIAELINKLEGVKPAHPDTVHNELIKDPRFVLVGRGVYALRENVAENSGAGK